MKRRSFLKTAAAGGSAAAASNLSSPAISQGFKEWRMVTSWPKGLPGLGTGAERLAERITALSGGRIAVKVYSAGELVPPLGTFDAVADGTAQLGHDAAYYHLGKSEGCAFYTSFPWGFHRKRNRSLGSVWQRPRTLWDELYKPFGIRGFLAGNTGTQMLGWFSKEINSVDDLKGLKFRAPGNQGKILRKLGATPVVLAGGEIFPALQSGAIDGAEWVGPYNDSVARISTRSANITILTATTSPAPRLQLMVNEEAWAILG